MDFAFPLDHKVKIKENGKRNKYSDHARELRKLWTMRMTVNRDHPDYSIVEISQNTEKSPGNQRRLAVTHTPVKNYQLTLMWKTLEYNNNNNNNNSRCPWCNGYRRRKWTRRHQFKSWTRLIAFHIALIPLGKVWIQSLSLQLWVNSRADWVLQPWWGN